MRSYPSIYNLGHRAVANLLDGPVLVEEKVDGSQFSFGIYEDGTLRCRSKGAVLNIEAPEKMFIEGVATAQKLARANELRPGWIYRGEYLKKAKHNTLAYDRVPKDHIIIFEIETGEEQYLGPEAKAAGAERLGLECVTAFYVGKVESAVQLRELLDTPSVLGGQKIEGVVIKPLDYNLYGQDQRCLLGKFVSEAFKEVHLGAWKKENPSSRDVIQQLIEKYRTPARWAKAVQHLREESGKIEDSPKDIGLLMREVGVDVLKEEREAIMNILFGYAWPKIQRGITSGLPEWYKGELLKLQFEKEAA